MLVDTTRARVVRLGPLAGGMAEADAVVADNELLHGLAETEISFALSIGDVTYECVGAAPQTDSLVLLRAGRYLHHFQLRHLLFRSLHPTGQPDLDLPDAHLEFHCWPDRLSVGMRVPAGLSQDRIAATVVIKGPDGFVGPTFTDPLGNEVRTDDQPAGRAAILENREGGGLAVLLQPGEGAVLTAPQPGRVQLSCATAATDHAPTVAVILVATASGVQDALAAELRELGSPLGANLRVESLVPEAGPCAVEFDPIAGSYQVALPPDAEIFGPERLNVSITNPDSFSRTVRLNFSRVSPTFKSITGVSPVILDVAGNPLGLPVQISKNWHVDPPWMSAPTMIHLEPGATAEFDLAIANAEWGGVPAVSHAQLCLEGWGQNQQWDQMAIGSFGESICYDPDIGLGRSMIDDVRPLMVWGFGETPRRKWYWTHNVGGGDFLVLVRGGERQFLSRQKSLYSSYGPVLADVTYAGQTSDGALQSEIRCRSWRSDDLVRAHYSIRYQVRSDIDDIERLAFFQLGADRYNENYWFQLAVGGASDSPAISTPDPAASGYTLRGLPLQGTRPWIATFDTTKPGYIAADDQGAFGDRGLVIRGWRARIDGEDVPLPHFSLYRDGQRPDGVCVELSPPAGITRLRAGDFVELELLMLVLPQARDDYYGNSAWLQSALAEMTASWELTAMEAETGVKQTVATVGQVRSAYPVEVEASADGGAEFCIQGGVGRTPITVAGLPRATGYRLERLAGTRWVDAAESLAPDWWQADHDPAGPTWALTFSPDLGHPEAAVKHCFRLVG